MKSLLFLCLVFLSCTKSKFANNGTPEVVLDPGEVLASLRVGIGYEDWKDMDFNDIALCFEGKFAVNESSGTVRSGIKQSINLTLTKISLFRYTVTVKIKRNNNFINLGIQTPSRGNSSQINFDFMEDDIIYITRDDTKKNLIPFSNKSDADNVKIEIDSCRNTGG